jgi:uncharacterized protein (TIGR02996 family)
MVDHERFIQAIAADPACESGRLVYADWLEEHGYASAADYLRTELELARRPLDASEAPALRDRLWQAWATVDPGWLMIFTQPRMLRANPTPFPSAWKNFDLGSLREEDGTYGTWPYDSIPALQVQEMRGEFQYLTVRRTPADRGDDRTSPRYRQKFERMLSDAAGKGIRLPEVFVKFMNNPDLHNTYRSVTDCFFTFPDDNLPIRTNSFGNALHVFFYSDSQDCLHWDLYVHPSGGHCVIARWLEYFDAAPPEPDNDRASPSEPRAWFVAPSFEAFVFRVWLENQIWYIEHADFLRRRGETPPAITPAIQAYMDHYRSNSSGK